MANSAVQTALGGACPACDDPMGAHEAGVCSACWRDLARAAGGRQEAPARHLGSLTVLGPYEGRLREIIRCFKYGDRPELAGPLADRLAARLAAPGGALADVDLIVCYLHPAAMRRLGPVLRERAKNGTRVVSVFFAFDDWEPASVTVCSDWYRTKVYVYYVGRQHPLDLKV